jgi:hypothetical protein
MDVAIPDAHRDAFHALLEELRPMWAMDTSSDPGWSPATPSKGQCAVTAMLVQDLFGGDLLRVVNDGTSHYFNRLDDATIVDLTRDQFDTWDPSPSEVRERAYLESNRDTVERYERLRTSYTLLAV